MFFITLEKIDHNLKKYQNAFLWAILLVAVLFSFYALTLGWSYPILDLHAFRQTQTAISAFWMIREGHFFAYQTPVIGYPWVIPFEFPLYQWLVVGVFKLSNIKLDQCGRIISILFFYLTLFPVGILLKKLNFKTSAYKIFICLFLCSPLYLYWSRAFLIESLSLFLSVSYVALIQSFLVDHKKKMYILAILVGSLAASVKVTTFVPCVFLATLLMAFGCFENVGSSKSNLNKKILLRLGWLLLLVIVPLLIAICWTSYCDHLKTANIIAADHLISKKLFTWNFGAWKQRISSMLWINTILLRTFNGGIGYYASFLYLITIIVYFKKIQFKWPLVFFCTYLSAFLIFTHLHIEHDYYSYANVIFLILAVSVILYSVLENKSYVDFFSVLILTIVLQLYFYISVYMKHAIFDTKNTRDYKISMFIRGHTSTSDAILVYGYDWSSVISYYSERKSLTDPLWGGNSKKRLENIEKLLGGLKLGAIVLCSSGITKEMLPTLEETIKKYKYTAVMIDGCYVFY